MKTQMKTKLIIAISALALLVSGCSHGAKKSEPSSSSRPEATRTSSGAPSSESITAKYSLLELAQAENLLKAIEEAGAKTPLDDKGTDIMGCPLAAKDARTSLVRLESLLDRAIRNEATTYSADPKAYGSAFETCGGNCACGAYKKVLAEANTENFNGAIAKLHTRNVQRLTAKATRLQPSESLACAHKQNWYCGSDLKAYLEKP